MITVKILGFSVLILLINYWLLRFATRIVLELKVALSFSLASIMMVYIINSYGSVPIENISAPDIVNKLVSWNYEIKKVQNSIVLVSLIGLTYGFYSQYQESKKNIFMASSGITLLLTLLFVYMIMSQL